MATARRCLWHLHANILWSGWCYYNFDTFVYIWLWFIDKLTPRLLAPQNFALQKWSDLMMNWWWSDEELMMNWRWIDDELIQVLYLCWYWVSSVDWSFERSELKQAKFWACTDLGTRTVATSLVREVHLRAGRERCRGPSTATTAMNTQILLGMVHYGRTPVSEQVRDVLRKKTTLRGNFFPY